MRFLLSLVVMTLLMNEGAMAAPSVYSIDVYANGVKEKTVVVGDLIPTVRFEPANVPKESIWCEPEKEGSQGRCDDAATHGKSKIELEISYLSASGDAPAILRIVERSFAGWQEICRKYLTGSDGQARCLLVPAKGTTIEFVMRADSLPKKGVDVSPDNTNASVTMRGHYRFNIEPVQ